MTTLLAPLTESRFVGLHVFSVGLYRVVQLTLIQTTTAAAWDDHPPSPPPGSQSPSGAFVLSRTLHEGTEEHPRVIRLRLLGQVVLCAPQQAKAASGSPLQPRTTHTRTMADVRTRNERNPTMETKKRTAVITVLFIRSTRRRSNGLRTHHTGNVCLELWWYHHTLGFAKTFAHPIRARFS